MDICQEHILSGLYLIMRSGGYNHRSIHCSVGVLKLGSPLLLSPGTYGNI